MPAADTLAPAGDDLDIMRSAALEAGRIAMRYADRGDTKAWDKTPGHPVTQADLAVNAFLEKTLRAARPDYGWLSEETVDDSSRLAKQRIWVVDPIDGTRAFMRGDPNWCIGVAVVEDGAAVAGVVVAPQFEEVFFAYRGGGAFLNDQRIESSGQREEPGSRLIAARGLIEHPSWREPWPKVVTPEDKPNATLYRLALVASGRWDGALALWRKSDWDLAAGAVLVEEAGGAISTHRGEAYRFNRRVPAQHSLVAAGKALHPLLVRRTKAVRLPDPQGSAAASGT
ncbi:MAG: 3'(2'),5'-bisphosphate nucleotidase CysQ [Pseudomonadota bacterium]